MLLKTGVEHQRISRFRVTSSEPMGKHHLYLTILFPIPYIQHIQKYTTFVFQLSETRTETMPWSRKSNSLALAGTMQKQRRFSLLILVQQQVQKTTCFGSPLNFTGTSHLLCSYANTVMMDPELFSLFSFSC